MAWSVPFWRTCGFHKVSLYLESFVAKHATDCTLETLITNYKKL